MTTPYRMTHPTLQMQCSAIPHQLPQLKDNSHTRYYTTASPRMPEPARAPLWQTTSSNSFRIRFLGFGFGDMRLHKLGELGVALLIRLPSGRVHGVGGHRARASHPHRIPIASPSHPHHIPIPRTSHAHPTHIPRKFPSAYAASRMLCHPILARLLHHCPHPSPPASPLPRPSSFPALPHTAPHLFHVRLLILERRDIFGTLLMRGSVWIG